jgi:lipopolysaccharide/colanic/teichoic acid biosynthesis glycosyltransferase
VTGLWQIKEKDAHTFHEWIEYDLQYVDERSLWFDLKILCGTLRKILISFEEAALKRSSVGPASARK